MNFDYRENMPRTDWVSQMAFLKKHGVDHPERWVKDYVFISKSVYCFKHCLEAEFDEHYKTLPFTQIKGFGVRGNTTTNFFIVMRRDWWEHIERTHNGDLSYLQRRLCAG